MTAVLSISLPIFFVILVGFVSGKRHLISHEASKVLSRYVFLFCMPPFLFLSMSRVPVREVINFSYIGAYALTLITTAGISILIGRIVFNYNVSELALHVMGSCYANSAYLGIPLLALAYGDIAPVVLITIFQVIFITPLILLALELDQGDQGRTQKGIGSILLIAFKNPIVAASFLGIAVAWYRLELPNFVVKVCELVGPAGVPTALFSIGLSLSNREYRLERGMSREVGYMVGAKMFAQPLLAFLIGKFIFALSSKWLPPLVIMSAMPTAMNNFLFSQTYGVYLRQSSAVVMVTTFLAVFTISTLLYLFGISS